MEPTRKPRLDRQDWVDAAFRILLEKGANGIKIVVIAEQLGVTSGSFYWHFKKLADLQLAVLDHWEHHHNKLVIGEAQSFAGDPRERIYRLMERVIGEGASEADHAISVWSNSEASVRQIYHRGLQSRYDFAGWMFREAGFTRSQSRLRGRQMVAYLMGETSSNLKSKDDWKVILRGHWAFLVADPD